MQPAPGAPLLLTCLAGSLLVWPSQSLPRGGPNSRRRPSSSPVERVLRSDGGPGIVLGRAVVVRDDYEKRVPPPRRDWCRTGSLMQRVREPGCRTSLLRNRYCYGQCKSFYVPREHTGGASNNGTASGAFESCAACRPVKFRSARVTFVCPGQVPPVRKRTLQRVHRCRCLAVASTVQSS